MDTELRAPSDRLYYQLDRQQHRISRLNMSMSSMDDTAVTPSPAIDEELIRKKRRQ